MKNTLFYLIVFSILFGFKNPQIVTAQKPRVVYVTAQNGLNYREKPEIQAKKLGKFDFATRLALIEETGVLLEVLDQGKKIKGQWLKVKTFIEDYHRTQQPKIQSGYVFSGFVVDSTKADFSIIPRLVKRNNIKFPRIQVKKAELQTTFTEKIITEKAYQNYASKYHNKIEIDQSILESEESNKYFPIRTKKSIYRFFSGPSYSSSYYYQGYIKEYNVYIIGHSFLGAGESYLLDRNNEKRMTFSSGETSSFGPIFSPDNKKMLFSEDAYGYFGATIDLYYFPQKNSIEGAIYQGKHKNNDWSIKEMVWIDNQSFAAKGYQQQEGSNKMIYQYFKVKIN